MEELIYINKKGQSIKIGNDCPFILTNIEGMGSPKITIQSQKSIRQDGESYIENTLDTRLISIKLKIVTLGINEMMDKRDEILQVFNPTLGEGKLVYKKGNVKREAKAIAEIPPYFPYAEPFDETMQPCLIQIICHNPFLFDEFETSEEIATWVGGLTFPLKLPTNFSVSGQRVINIINKGHAETPMKIEMHGPATNPKILKRETGEFIKVKANVLEGEVLVITTNFGEKKVEINGENKFNYIDHESTFFDLEVGDNVIEATTDDETENTTFKITYRNRYLGV